VFTLYNEYNYFPGLTVLMEDNNVIYTSLRGGLLYIKQIRDGYVYGVDTW